MKKRIMICSEASFLNTGYANYTRELLNYLHKTDKYELAELACYGQRNDPQGTRLPWKYYGVQPNKDFHPVSNYEISLYEKNTIGQFGGFLFESACLDFKPDIVFDLRDFWMTEFISRSPFRNCFRWVLMPTVDAAPQARQWIDMYKTTDALFTYSEWSGDVLVEQAGENNVNYFGTASPCPSELYQKLNRIDCRLSLGLPRDAKIVGTVMRNQRRKLYPDLFKAFKLFLDKVKDPENYYLYCHTYYPDLGWDIPELLQDTGLASKVYFTYLCKDTGRIFSSLYSGPKAYSPFTGKYTSEMCNVRAGASTQQLAIINNCFDIYIQYANSEGFGIPLVEAAACAVPIAAVDYSAMSSIIKNLDGIALPCDSHYKELETGCLRAVPNNEATSEILLDFFGKSDEERLDIGLNTKDKCSAFYNWERTGSAVSACFDTLDVVPYEKGWGERNIALLNPQPIPSKQDLSNASIKEMARWLISNVLLDYSKIDTYFEARLVRDLTYGYKTSTVGGVYTNESSVAFDGRHDRQPFSFEDAYRELYNIRMNYLEWQKRRLSIIK
jgi:glycosyltransferase involved in cell wall biosynthesis